MLRQTLSSSVVTKLTLNSVTWSFPDAEEPRFIAATLQHHSLLRLEDGSGRRGRGNAQPGPYLGARAEEYQYK